MVMEMQYESGDTVSTLLGLATVSTSINQFYDDGNTLSFG